MVSLALTVVVETAIAFALRAAPRRRLLVDVPLVNLFTHPLATMAHQFLRIGFLPLEAAVTFVEAVGYRAVTGLRWRRASALSLVCNAATAGLSFLF